MSKVLIHRAAPALAMGVLFAIMGFSYSLATPGVGGRAFVVPPACTLPPMREIPGNSAGVVLPPGCGTIIPPPPAPPPPPPRAGPAVTAYLGTVVVGQPFTRLVNIADGNPPYDATLTNVPANVQLALTVQTDAGATVSGTFFAPALDQNGVDLPAPYLTGSLPKDLAAGNDFGGATRFFSFDITFTDQTPGAPPPPPTDAIVVTVCMGVVEVDRKPNADLTIERLTRSSATITPVSVPPGGAPDSASDPFTYNGTAVPDPAYDLPNGLQNKPYEYKLHANGGVSTGGQLDPDQGSTLPGVEFSPADGDDSRAGALAFDPASFFAGTGAGSYTVTVGPTDTELTVTASGDPGLASSSTQNFTGLPAEGVGPPVTISIGGLGVRLVVDQTVVGTIATPNTGLEVGDSWTFFFTAYAPNYQFSLDKDSQNFIPDGLNVQSNGTIDGTPRRAGDFSFFVNVTSLDDPLKTIKTIQLFIRIEAGPVSSDFVIAHGGFRLNFGALNRDSLNFALFLRKKELHNFSQLVGASFNVKIGADGSTEEFILTNHIDGGTLTFHERGIHWPPPLVVGDPVNRYKQDARVTVQPIRTGTGFLRIRISKVALIEAMKADTFASIGIPPPPPPAPRPVPEVRIRIEISGGNLTSPINVEEVVSFAYRQRGFIGQGRILRGHPAASAGIGQFLVDKVNGRIVFDPTTGSDTLRLKIQGFLRSTTRTSIDPATLGVAPGALRLFIHLGAQCGLDTTFDAAEVRIKGGATPTIIVSNTAGGLPAPLGPPGPGVPVQRFVLNNRTGRFTILTRTPTTNAALIQGLLPPPIGIDPGLVVGAPQPFVLPLRIRIFDPGPDTLPNTSDDIVHFDGNYDIFLFRHGSLIGTQ